MLDIQQVGHARGHLQRILSTLSVFLPLLSSRAYILSIQIESTLHSRGPILRTPLSTAGTPSFSHHPLQQGPYLKGNTLYSRDPIF